MYTRKLNKLEALLYFCQLFGCLEATNAGYSNGKKETTSQVVVRAVFINCEPDEKRSILDDEATRFEREELFKHGALRNCEKKLALTIKMSNEPDQVASDEYIPIEHVLDWNGKKRVRLLDPYVLRLRSEPTRQAYKLRHLETVSGILINSEEKEIQKRNKKGERKIRSERSANNVDYSDKSTESDVILRYNDDSNLSTVEAHTESFITSAVTASTCENNASSILRNKRHEQNIVIDGEMPTWLVTDQVYPNNKDELIRPIELNKYDAPQSVDDFQMQSNNWKNEYDMDKKSSKRSNRFKDHVDFNLSSFTKKKVNDAPVINKTKQKHSVDSRQILNTEHEEKKFALYKICNPELWYSVHVQLFEKINTPEGKTVWNDLTKGEPARINSANPEWTGQDLNIKYRSTEYLTRKDFTLPESNLCLLAPLQDTDTNSLGSDEIFSNENNGQLLVVPLKDVITVDRDTKKRSEYTERDNTSDFIASKEKLYTQDYRRVMVRVSRDLDYDKNKLNIVKEGSESYLTLPYNRPHVTQMDLEARADDNQLVRVGSSGRITIAASDNTRKTRTTITVQATNTGLAAARFRVKTRDCGPELLSWFIDNGHDGLTTQPVLLPPRHTRRVKIEMPTELPVDNVNCSLVLVNDNDESVAIRDVSIKKGDRCFCVWYCDCVCLSEDPKLLCNEMPESKQAAAGLSARERPRHARSIKCNNCVTVNFFTAFLGVFVCLLSLGFIKAVLGQIFQPIGCWGLNMILQPRIINNYYEKSLKDRSVIYDLGGWPVHPDTKKRSVRFLSRLVEFSLNVMFFIALPYMLLRNSFIETVIICTKESKSDKKKKKAQTAKKKRDAKKNKKDVEKMDLLHLQHQKALRKWMSPDAEELSKELWHAGLRAIPINSEINCPALLHKSSAFLTADQSVQMRPLLQEDIRNSRAEAYHSSCDDSDQNDTEYVLMQMKKSKESLARSQRKNESGLPAKTQRLFKQ